jgi:exosortase/archaeosortase family protein
VAGLGTTSLIAYVRARLDTAAIGRRELFIWLVFILLANQLLRLNAASLSGLGEALFDALQNKSAIYYLGWYATLQLLLDDRTEEAATKSDVAFALSVTLFNFLPGYSIPWLSATATGLYLLATSRGNTRQNAAAAVLLALAFNGFWGPKLFDFFAIYLLRADAALVGAALSATQSGMSWDDTIVGTPEGHRVLIFGPCSSFHNISLGLLCWVAISRLVRQVWRWQDLWIGLAVCTAVVLLNGTRLYLMALNPESFGYWHHEFGATIFTWVTTLTILLISLWGIYRTERQA